MTTYYELLQVDISASSDEIKRAFRRRAKEVHPDVNPSDRETAETMRRLLRAYEILSDPVRRDEYDRRMRVLRPEYRFDYRSFLQSRPDDPEFQSKLVFFDLLHHRETDAAGLHDRLRQSESFNLADHLDREDFMDCGLLLAEEYERQRRYREAFELLEAIIELELDQAYFRHFFVEVTDALRSLVCHKMPVSLPARTVVAYINRVLRLDLPDRELAMYMKRAAEIHVDLGEPEVAMACLQRGIGLNSKLQGTKKLKERISSFSAVRT